MPTIYTVSQKRMTITCVLISQLHSQTHMMLLGMQLQSHNNDYDFYFLNFKLLMIHFLPQIHQK
jgi:hypothetical protein